MGAREAQVSAVAWHLQLEEREAQVDYLRKGTLVQAEQIEQMRLEQNIIQIELEEARRKQEEEVEAMHREWNRVQRELEEARQQVQELER